MQNNKATHNVVIVLVLTNNVFLPNMKLTASQQCIRLYKHHAFPSIKIQIIQLIDQIPPKLDENEFSRKIQDRHT